MLFFQVITFLLCSFRYELIEPPDGEWGRLVHGRYTGLVGLLERRVNLTMIEKYYFDIHSMPKYNWNKEYRFWVFSAQNV